MINDNWFLLHFHLTGQYGIPKPFYFPIQKSYWCGSSQKSIDTIEADNQIGMNQLNPNGMSCWGGNGAQLFVVV